MARCFLRGVASLFVLCVLAFTNFLIVTCYLLPRVIFDFRFLCFSIRHSFHAK